MKINWFSNAPWAKTGYGTQTGLFLPRIRDLGHQMSCTAFYGLEGGVLSWNGIRVYPRANANYGQDVWSSHAHNEQSDVCISLMDAWVFAPQANPHNVPWVAWFPVDMEPLPAPVLRTVKQAFKRIVMSRFGAQMCDNAGLDYFYVPHGVDCDIFKPDDMAVCRERLGWPQDKFVVGMVAANKGNPSRKAFTQQIEAFKLFHAKRPDSMLYLHTERMGVAQGVNLAEFVEFMGLRQGVMGMCNHTDVDVLFVDQYANTLGIPDQYMVDMYNALDVHMLVSMGEGFGIPTLEAQACGCPVITSGWTASDELCFSGWKVQKQEADKWFTPLAAYQWQPRVQPIADRLETAYQCKGNAQYRTAARAGAMRYDADLITKKYWQPTLETIEAQLPPKLAAQP